MTDTRCLALSARRSTNIYCTVNHLGRASSSSSSSFSPSSPHWPATTLSLSNLGQQIDSYIGPSLSEHLKSSVAKRLAIQRYLVTNHTQKKRNKISVDLPDKPPVSLRDIYAARCLHQLHQTPGRSSSN